MTHSLHSCIENRRLQWKAPFLHVPRSSSHTPTSQNKFWRAIVGVSSIATAPSRHTIKTVFATPLLVSYNDSQSLINHNHHPSSLGAIVEVAFIKWCQIALSLINHYTNKGFNFVGEYTWNLGFRIPFLSDSLYKTN